MLRHSLIVLFFCLVGCSYRVLEPGTIPFRLQKHNIVDLSADVDFNFRTNALEIRDSTLILALCKAFKDSGKKGQFVFQMHHEDRYYLSTHMANIQKLKQFFVTSGVPEKRIEALVGSSFARFYHPDLENSEIILIIR